MARQRYRRRLARHRKPGASLLTRSPSALPRPARTAGFSPFKRECVKRIRFPRSRTPLPRGCARLASSIRSDRSTMVDGRPAAEVDGMTEKVTEYFDVLIVGAGISGIGGAYHLTKQCPDTRFVVLETQESFGGTWLTHRYPGIRSYSDLYTFGYRFKPWTSAPSATAPEILSYMGEIIDENDLARHIRYRHTISTACWRSDEKLWTIEATRADTGERVRSSANFLWMCQGYYRHSEGYTPEWNGMASFKGRIVHPQSWPEYLE